MSHQNSSILTKHVKKKVKQDLTDLQSSSNDHRQNYRSTTLEPRRDLPLNKIPELLAKITGTFSSAESKQSISSTSSLTVVNSTDRRVQLFEQYSKGDIIDLDGLLRFCNDLTLEPDCYEILLFCFLCRAKQMYSLTRTEFFRGLENLGNHCQTLNDVRISLSNYQITDDENEFYLWTFHFGLIDGTRCLTTTNAISLWRLFYSKQVERPSILDQWLQYLEENVKHDVPKTITSDTWSIFPQFANFIQSNGYQVYDDNEAWPCLFDSFVEFQLEQKQTS